MPDQEVPGPDSRISQVQLLHQLTRLTGLHQTGNLEGKGSFQVTGASGPSETSTSTSPGQALGKLAVRSGNSKKGNSGDSEQHIPDEILNDLYPFNPYTTKLLSEIDNNDHSVPNQEVPDLDNQKDGEYP